MDRPTEKKKKKRKEEEAEEEEAVASRRHPCFVIVFFLFSFFSVFFPYKWCFGPVSIYRPKQPDFASTVGIYRSGQCIDTDNPLFRTGKNTGCTGRVPAVPAKSNCFGR